MPEPEEYPPIRRSVVAGANNAPGTATFKSYGVVMGITVKASSPNANWQMRIDDPDGHPRFVSGPQTGNQIFAVRLPIWDTHTISISDDVAATYDVKLWRDK